MRYTTIFDAIIAALETGRISHSEANELEQTVQTAKEENVSASEMNRRLEWMGGAAKQVWFQVPCIIAAKVNAGLPLGS